MPGLGMTAVLWFSSPRLYSSPNVHMWEHNACACTAVKVCTRVCGFFVYNHESLFCLLALCIWLWLDLLEAFIHCSLSLTLFVSLPLSPRSVPRPPRTISPHHPCACPGMCLKAWATSGRSLSTSATCLMTQRTSAWSGKRRASQRFLSKVKYESLSLEESFFQQGEGFVFSPARFSERCHLSVERPDSSVPSSCRCLSSVYFNAFMPHSSMPLSVVCSLIFNGYVASEIFMLCFLSCIIAAALYVLLCCHIYEFDWYVCFWSPLWLMFNWNINVLW